MKLCLLFVSAALSLSAQTLVVYSYDTAGKPPTARELVFDPATLETIIEPSRITVRAKQTAAAPIVIKQDGTAPGVSIRTEVVDGVTTVYLGVKPRVFVELGVPYQTTTPEFKFLPFHPPLTVVQQGKTVVAPESSPGEAPTR